MKFKKQPHYHTKFAMAEGTLVIDLGSTCRVLSSAVRGGGMVHARYILNHQVPGNPIAAPHSKKIWPEPSRYLGHVATRLGLRHPVVGLMTAVDVRRVVVMRETWQDVWVEAWVTVGVTNAVRAGEFPSPSSTTSSQRGSLDHPYGTINIILVTNARLSSSALVGVVQVATEGKAAALFECKVKSWTGLAGATGTGTDSVVVASGEGPALRFSGTHTPIGGMVGRLIRNAIARRLQVQRHETSKKK